MDAALRRARGEKSAMPYTERFSSHKIDRAVSAIKEAQDKLQVARKLLSAEDLERAGLEKSLAHLETVVKFAGCRCVSDSERGECRLESMETGKARAHVNYLGTCAQDCARWYSDPYVRVGCASRNFLNKAQADWSENKKAYDGLIVRQKRSYQDFKTALEEQADAFHALDASRAEIAGEITPTAEGDSPTVPAPPPPLSMPKPQLPSLPF